MLKLCNRNRCEDTMLFAMQNFTNLRCM